MGCNCKKPKSQSPRHARDNTIHYVFCPNCKEVKAIRIDERELIGRRCDKCKEKTIYFNKPPTPKKLKLYMAKKGRK